MIRLAAAPHTRTGDTVVEVWRDGALLATIYPSPTGVKIVSKHIDPNRPGLVTVDPLPPAAVHIALVP